MKRKMLIILTLLGILFLGWIAYGYFSVRNIESPNYKVISKNENFEIREYDAMVIAQTTVKAEKYSQSVNDGFLVIADYIFGNNISKDKIAMTTPVVTQNKSETATVSEKIAMTTPVVTQTNAGEMMMYFVMPSQFKIDELPIPNNQNVELVQIPKQTRLVLEFSGWAYESRIESKIEAFKQYAKKNNLTLESIQVAQYNPPWTPPFMRRNEIWAVVSE